MKDIVGLLCAVIVIIATAGITYRGTSQYLNKRKPTPAEPTELDDLVQQERSKQGVLGFVLITICGFIAASRKRRG